MLRLRTWLHSGRIFGLLHGRGRARLGAGRFGLLTMPQPVMGADSDLNRGVSAAEFATAAGVRFLLLDTDRDGRLARPELLAQLPKIDPRRERRRRR